MAGALAGMGVTKGDRVALYLQNTPHFIIGFLGAMRAGAVVVPMNPMLVCRRVQPSAYRQRGKNCHHDHRLVSAHCRRVPGLWC